MLGVPFDSGTSYRSGARLGPREIRAQSSLIRPYSYFQKISPFETLAIVDAGDVDAPPVGIEQAYAAIEAGVARVLDAGAMPARRRRRSLDLAAVPARRVADARPARAGPVRRAHRHLGGLLRRQVFPRLAVPARDRGADRRRRRSTSRSASAARCTARTRTSRSSATSGVTTIDIGMVKRDGVDATMARVREIVAGPAALRHVRHRLGRSRVRARHGHAGGRRADELRGAGARPRARRPQRRRLRRRRSRAAVRRSRPDHRAARGEYHVRDVMRDRQAAHP